MPPVVAVARHPHATAIKPRVQALVDEELHATGQRLVPNLAHTLASWGCILIPWPPIRMAHAAVSRQGRRRCAASPTAYRLGQRTESELCGMRAIHSTPTRRGVNSSWHAIVARFFPCLAAETWPHRVVREYSDLIADGLALAWLPSAPVGHRTGAI